MLLTQTAEYALRLVSVLQAHPEERLTAVALSEAANVPAPYVNKVMRRLVVAGLVSGTKGHHGGFALALPADQITVLAVLDAVGFEVDRTRCAFGVGACNPKHPCALHSAVSVLTDDFLRWARTTTLHPQG